MRLGWTGRALGDVCTIQPPKREAKQRLADHDLVSFVPMNDLGVRQKQLHLSTRKPLREVAGSYTYFAEGDVLLAKITPCFENGKLGLARGLTNEVGFGSSEFIVFRVGRDLTPEYLFYFLSQDCFRDSGARVMSGAVGHKRVPKEFIESYPIPIPPLSEQKRIVAILDETFSGIEAAIANTEKNLANARELFYCYLNKMFTVHVTPWDVVTVDKVCESIVDCVNKTAPTVDGPTPYKMIRTTNVRHGEISLKSVKYVTEDVFRAWTRRQIPKRGDVILTREAPLGEVGVLDTEEKVFLGQRLVSYRTNPHKLNSRFLSYAFQSEYVQSQVRALASGSTVQHMRVPDSSKLNIRLPSLEVQNEAVRSLDFIKKETTQLKTICQRKIEALTELKQSLLQKAFSGELTAEPADEVREAVA